MLVSIDAGHGAGDPGAMYMNGVEKDINLMYALTLAEMVQGVGNVAHLIRSDDTYILPSHRAAMANQASAKVFVSLHCNSCPTPETARGVEVLYYPTSVAGRFIADGIVRRWDHPIKRGSKPRGDLAVLKYTKMPAVLVEMGFINHSDDLALLRDPGYMTVNCQAILSALEEYDGLI